MAPFPAVPIALLPLVPPVESFLITAAVISLCELRKLWLSMQSFLLTKENQLWPHRKQQDPTDAHPANAHPAKNTTEFSC